MRPVQHPSSLLGSKTAAAGQNDRPRWQGSHRRRQGCCSVWKYHRYTRSTQQQAVRDTRLCPKNLLLSNLLGRDALHAGAPLSPVYSKTYNKKPCDTFEPLVSCSARQETKQHAVRLADPGRCCIGVIGLCCECLWDTGCLRDTLATQRGWLHRKQLLALAPAVACVPPDLQVGIVRELVRKSRARRQRGLRLEACMEALEQQRPQASRLWLLGLAEAFGSCTAPVGLNTA